jgi:hypothetical protein
MVLSNDVPPVAHGHSLHVFQGLRLQSAVREGQRGFTMTLLW